MKFFTTFLGSFYSTQTYREVRASGNYHLGYAFTIVAVSASLILLFGIVTLHLMLFATRDGKISVVDDVIMQIAEQVPVMTVEKNRLMTKDPVASIITIDATVGGEQIDHFPLITIDTTGGTTHDTMQTPLLITDKDVIIKSDRKTEIKSLSEFTHELSGPLVINRALATDMATKAIGFIHEHLLTVYLFLGAFVWAFFVAFMYILRVVMLLVLALLGLAIGSLLKFPLRYSEAFALASVSYTPVALLDAMVGYSTSAMVLFLAGGATLFIAILALRRGANATTTI